MNSDSAVVMMSPATGKSPISASRPKRTPVPGMTSAVSSRVASASIRAMRAPGERGRTKSSKPKPYVVVMVVVLRGPDRDAGRRAQAFNRREAALAHVRGRRVAPWDPAVYALASQLRGREAIADNTSEEAIKWAR